MTNYRDEILKAASLWAELTGKRRSTAALKIVNDGKFFDRIAQGGGCTFDTYEKVISWFASNTPAPPGKKQSRRRKQAAS